MKKYGLIITALIAAFGCLFSLALILGQDTFIWDEGHHAYFGNLIYRDLLGHNLPGFLADTSRQAWFQPFHSYLNGIFLLLLGKSYLSIRLSNWTAFLLLFFVIYRFSLHISREKGWIIAAIANFLLATSPMMLVMSSLNMQEIMGALVISLVLIFYILRCEKGPYHEFIILGFLLSLVLLVKYHYGILLGFAVFLAETARIIDLEDKSYWIRTWLRNNLFILLGFIPVTALWFLTPPIDRKIGLFLYRLQDVQGWGRGLNVFQRAFFYFQSMLTDYTFSLWLGFFMILSLLYAFKYFKDFKIRALLALFFSFFIFHSAIIEVFERLISPAMPAIFILSGIVAVDLWEKHIVKFDRTVVCIASIIAGLILVGDLVFLLPYSKEVANYSCSAIIYKKGIPDIHPPFFFRLVNRPGFLFPLNPTVQNYPRFSLNTKSRLRDVLDYFNGTVPKDKSVATLISMQEMSPYVLYWHFSDRKTNVLTVNDYAVIGRYFWYSDYFLVLDVDKSSLYATQVMEDPKRWKEISGPLIQRGWLSLFAKKDFKDLGMTAKIYKMNLAY